MNIFKISLLGATLLLATVVAGQINTPQPSPTASITQKVGLTDISVTYSRPGAKDRAIFGELVPYGELWRTGANKATTIKFSTNVKIGDSTLKAGSYSLFTIPNKDAWTVILNTNADLSGTAGYEQAKDAVRLTITPTNLQDEVETFTIDFSHIEAANGHLNISWANTKISIPIATDANAMVEKQIKEVLIDGPSAATYFNAAKYYLDNDKDLNQALVWMNVAVQKRPDAFWYLHQKAKLQAKLGQKKEAIKTAELSLKMARENKDGDFGYIANNEKLLEELKK